MAIPTATVASTVRPSRMASMLGQVRNTGEAKAITTAKTRMTRTRMDSRNARTERSASRRPCRPARGPAATPAGGTAACLTSVEWSLASIRDRLVWRAGAR
jgi:hypothetical protein